MGMTLLSKGARQPPLFGPCLLWPNGRPSQLLHGRPSQLLLSICCTAHGSVVYIGATWRIQLKLCTMAPSYSRNLANAIKLVLPSAQTSPQPANRLVQPFCTAHGIYFTTGRVPISPKLSLPMGDLDRHLMHDSFGSSEPTTRTASPSVQSFWGDRL